MAVKSRWLGRGYESVSLDQPSGTEVIGDEPAAIGGSDAGPSPFAFLQMALGSCAVGTLLRAARDEQIPIEDLEVEVAFKLNRLDETATSHFTVTCGLRMTEIRERIRVTGEISEEQAAIRGYTEILESVPIRNAILFQAIQDIIRDEQEHLEELEALQPEG